MRNDRARWYQCFRVLGCCLTLWSCAAPQDSGSPRIGNAACHQLDVGMGMTGISAVPTAQIEPRLRDDHYLDPGSFLFRTTSPQRGVDGGVLYPPGVQLAATRPYATRPFFTVYAMRPEGSENWLPASGVINWPASGKDNAWLDVVSVETK